MKKSVSLDIFLLCFLLCLPSLGPSATVGQVEIVSPVVSSSLPSHAPVLITHNDNFTQQGFSGSGTEGNPYVLEGYSIVNHICINITDTDAHFEIKNCIFESASSFIGFGISFTNVNNALIENCTFTGFEFGISWEYVIDSSINELVISNCDYGFYCWYNDDVVVRNTSISGAQILGFYMRYTNDVQIKNCYSSKRIKFEVCDNVLVSGNIITDSDMLLIGVNHFLIVNNSIHNGKNGIIGIRGYNGTIRSNVIFKNDFNGIDLIYPHNYTVCENLVSQNGLSGGNAYGIKITSSPTDPMDGAFNNTFYGNVIGNNSLGNVYDMTNNTSWDDGISVGNTWSDYNGSGVYDILGEYGLVDNYPSGIEPVHIDTPQNNLTLKYQTTGKSISWDFTTDYPVSYEVFRNQTPVVNGIWDGSTITVDMDGLAIGVHQYDIFTYDLFGNEATDRVYVNVLEITGPTIEVYHYPIHPTSADYIIDYSAIVTDPSGVEKVILSISIDGGVWQNLTMYMQEPGIWNVSMSQPSGGHGATYKAYAMDSLGNWAVSEEHSFTVEQLPDYSFLYMVLVSLGVGVLVALVIKLRN